MQEIREKSDNEEVRKQSKKEGGQKDRRDRKRRDSRGVQGKARKLLAKLFSCLLKLSIDYNRRKFT